MTDCSQTGPTEVILSRWRSRFPNNAYAWPGAPESFASEAAKALRDHIETLEVALRHADEALFWHKGRAFELDGKTVGEVIDAALALPIRHPHRN